MLQSNPVNPGTAVWLFDPLVTQSYEVGRFGSALAPQKVGSGWPDQQSSSKQYRNMPLAEMPR
jgi:hypothetical protein